MMGHSHPLAPPVGGKGLATGNCDLRRAVATACPCSGANWPRMKRNQLPPWLCLNQNPSEGGGATPAPAPAPTPAPSPAPNPTATEVVLAGGKTEDMIRIEGELQSARAEIETLRGKVTTTEAERKDREVTICELQDKLEGLKREKRQLEDAIGAKRGFKLPTLLIGEE